MNTLLAPFRAIEDVLRWMLDRLHDDLTLSYGWSIVVLVLLVRSALLPLMVKQYKSMRRMQVVAPQLKELQQKYKGDRAKQQEEMMRFYQENNINPFASCAPMIVQMPVFIALYYVLKNFASGASESTDTSFMGLIPDITENVGTLSLWSTAILALVYGGSQLLSSELSFEPHTPDMQKRMMRALPAVIVISAFQFPFPAGLAIYWVTSNLFTAAQQLVIRHKIELDMEEHPEEFQGEKRSSRTEKREATPVAGEAAPVTGAPAVEAAPAADGPVAPRSANRGTPPKRKQGGSKPRQGGQRRSPKKRR